jgi:hypothetical protein
MWAWIVKLVSGWLPIGTNSSGDKKSFGEWAGKLCWVVGIVVACMAFQSVVEHFFPSKPNVTTIGQGGTQIIYQEQRDVAGFGCNAWRMYIRSGIKQK